MIHINSLLPATGLLGKGEVEGPIPSGSTIPISRHECQMNARFRRGQSVAR